jgi:hypothetical protein
MGTSFDCPILFSAHPQTGQIIMGVGPFEMGNLAEMLEYLGTEEFRQNAIEASARALTRDDEFIPSPYPQPQTPGIPVSNIPPDVVVHLRGVSRTACGLELWVTMPDGRRVAAVGSVSKAFPEHVNCEACRRVWIEQTQ